MALQQEGRTAGTRRPPNTYLLTRRLNLTTPVEITPQLSVTRRRDCCNAPTPRLVRHVDRLDGGSADACQNCFLKLTAGERHAALVSRWDALFRRLRPWGFNLRGAGREAAYA